MEILPEIKDLAHQAICSLKQRHVQQHKLGHVAQSVTSLATDVSLTADPGVASLILARSHNFVEIDHEIISPFR